MKTKEVVDDITMNRAITRITYEIIERNKDLNQVVLAGIKTRWGSLGSPDSEAVGSVGEYRYSSRRSRYQAFSR